MVNVGWVMSFDHKCWRRTDGRTTDSILSQLVGLEHFVLGWAKIIIYMKASCFSAVPELVLLEDLNNDHHLRHLEMGLPNHLEFNLKRQDGKKLKLRLEENVRLNANAPVYEAVLENGKQKARLLDVPLIIVSISPHSFSIHLAFILAWRKTEPIKHF